MLDIAVLTSTSREQLPAAGADLMAQEVGDVEPADLRQASEAYFETGPIRSPWQI